MEEIIPSHYETDPLRETKKSKICNICYQFKNIIEFEITGQTKNKIYRKAGCRPCVKNERLKEKKLKKIYGKNKPIGTPCDNCGKTKTKLSLDHCHATGQFRGWLCHPCNTAIGVLGDDLESLKRAVEYLERAELGLNKTPPVSEELDFYGK